MVTDASTRAHVLGIGTSLPPYGADQATVARFMSRVLRAAAPGEPPERALDLMEKVHAASGIEYRHSAIPDFGLDDPSRFQFFPPRWDLEPFPSTATRMRMYERASVDLADKAGARALASAGLSADAVSHLVVCTCTGFFAPGPDLILMERLGLRRTVARTTIGFMGCHAGLNGLRTVDQIVRSSPGATVLLICVELCTLHYQKRPEPGLVVANSLFADGCAALVVSSERRRGEPCAEIRTFRSLVAADSRDQISWHIGDTGFEMRLDVAVPATLRKEAPAFVQDLLREAGLERSDVAGWAIHPGGRKVIEAIGEALEIAPAALAPSLGVLRDCGNMSSPTIFFVLERLLGEDGVSGPIAALAFGPGLTIEGAVLSC